MAEKSIDLVLRARDEASAKLAGDIGRIGRGMQSALLGMTGVAAGVKMAIMGATAAMAQFNVEQVAAQGTADEILEAQVKAEAATRQLASAIPFVGSAITQALAAFSDEKPMQDAIKNIQKVRAETQKLHDLNIKLMREQAEARAKLEGKTESEISAIKAQFAGEDRAAQRKAALDNEALARTNLRQAEERMAAAQQNLVREQTDFLPAQQALRNYFGRRYGSFGTEAAKDEINAARAALIDLQKAYSDATAERKRLDALAVESGNIVQEQIKVQAQKEQEQARETERVKAEATQREEEYKLATIAREQQAAERARQAEMAAEARAAEAERQELRRTADERASLEAVVLRAMGRDSEAQILEIRRRYERMREESRVSLDLIAAAEAAELQNVRSASGYAPGQPQTRDVQAFTSRFLTTAPGREEPKWATELNESSDKQTRLLEEIARKAGITVEQVSMN